MAEHHVHGEMDITEQKKTFAGFVRWSARACVLIALVLIYLALTQTS